MEVGVPHCSGWELLPIQAGKGVGVLGQGSGGVVPPVLAKVGVTPCPGWGTPSTLSHSPTQKDFLVNHSYNVSHSLLQPTAMTTNKPIDARYKRNRITRNIRSKTEAHQIHLLFSVIELFDSKICFESSLPIIPIFFCIFYFF